jgi:putative ABC transport system substrate-binding protein
VKVGLLTPYALDPSPEGTAFRQALRDLGYVEGQNLTLVLRNGSGKEAIARNAAELANLPVDVIVAVGNDPVRAAREATGTIPIVMTESSDPVGQGLVASLARPGGQVTGLTTLGARLGAKRLELLKAFVPGAAHVAVLWVSNTGEEPDLRELQETAAALGVRLSVARGNGLALLSSSYDQMLKGGVDGAVVLTTVSVRSAPMYQKRLADFAIERRLPAIYEWRDIAEAGGLLAYGPSLPAIFRRAAEYVDKIFKGTKPSDLPVEQPTTFDLVVNLRTAQALGLSIPESVLQQATEVIQ